VALLTNNNLELEIVRSVGYPTQVIGDYQRFAADAPLPLADAARSGHPVWLESSAAVQRWYDHTMPAHADTGTEGAAALPLVSHGRVLGAMGLSFAQPQTFSAEERTFILALSQQCAEALERTQLYAQAQQSAAALEARVRDRTVQLRALNARVETLREAERTRIAREVHDELGGTLTAIKLNIRQVERGLPEVQPDLSAEFESLFELVDDAVHTVRRIATDLRPAVLDDLGLVAAIEWQTIEFTRRTGTPCERALEVEEVDLPRDMSTAIFRVLQEALTNVARHAQASHVMVGLQAAPGQLQLTVRDNGRGFEWPGSGRRSSLGLAGMQERVTGFGGRLEIESAPNQGTHLRVYIPLTAT
jgi:signal transduction histidine kinase